MGRLLAILIAVLGEVKACEDTSKSSKDSVLMAVSKELSFAYGTQACYMISQSLPPLSEDR